MKLRYLIGAVFALVLLIVARCVTLRLEDSLKADIAKWYSLHGLLMDTKAPQDFAEHGMTEKELFLRLPESRQRDYIRIFWQIRWDGMEKEFGERLAYARFQCRRENRASPWQTDQGRLFLLCGYPFEVQYYHDGEMVPTFDEFAASYGDWLQRWHFQWGRTFVRYSFRYANLDRWFLIQDVDDSLKQREFENYCRQDWGPSYNGWELAFQEFF